MTDLIQGGWRIYASLKQPSLVQNIGLPHGWRQAIVWTNFWMSLIEPLGTNLSEILVEFHIFSFKKIRLENGGHCVSASMC